jgi:ABC-2 type transport system ATP-binding protein
MIAMSYCWLSSALAERLSFVGLVRNEMAYQTLGEQAKIEAERISCDLEQYRIVDAIEKILAFSQSHFAISSPEYRAFRDTAVALSQRYNASKPIAETVSRRVRDDDEDRIVWEINRLANRMAREAQLLEDDESTRRNTALKSSPGSIVLVDECYKSFDDSEFSLGPVQIAIDEGDVFALMGPNASGKSTLLRMILGELAPSKGKISYPGLRRTFTYRNIRSAIGYVPQFPSYWNGTLGQHLRYYLSVRNICGEENNNRVEYYLHRFRLKQYEHQSWNAISGGNRLRVALARELLVEPKLLILDEPLAHLDVDSQLDLLEIIKDLSNRFWDPVSVVLTSQHIYETERFCTKVLVLGSGGKPVVAGHLSELIENQGRVFFEIETPASQDELKRALGETIYKITGRAPVFLVSASQSCTMEILVQRLVSHQIRVVAIRDISSSTRRFFGSANKELASQ